MDTKKLLIHSVWFVATMMIVIWLTASLLLTFVPEQTLQRYYLNSVWLNRHYGFYQPSPPLTAFRAGDTRYIHHQGVLFREKTPVLKTSHQPVGAVLIGEQHVIAMQNQLWIFSESGTQRHRLGSPVESPTMISKIGVHYGLPVLQTTQGMWRGDPASWRWTPVELFGVSWSEPITVPDDLVSTTVRRVTLQQLLDDIVTGRIVFKGQNP